MSFSHDDMDDESSTAARQELNASTTATGGYLSTSLVSVIIVNDNDFGPKFEFDSSDTSDCRLMPKSLCVIAMSTPLRPTSKVEDLVITVHSCNVKQYDSSPWCRVFSSSCASWPCLVWEQPLHRRLYLSRTNTLKKASSSTALLT